jgi:hypothetical protein
MGQSPFAPDFTWADRTAATASRIAKRTRARESIDDRIRFKESILYQHDYAPGTGHWQPACNNASHAKEKDHPEGQEGCP